MDGRPKIIMDETELMAIIERAAQDTATKELAILRNGKVERNFTACFAHEIEKSIHTDGIRVDPFCNKHRGAAKYLDGKLIELDIAVHARNIDVNNLVAIEIETDNHPKGDDIWKLEKLTQDLYGYGYKLGVYIAFGVQGKAGQISSIRWFKKS